MSVNGVAYQTNQVSAASYAYSVSNTGSQTSTAAEAEKSQGDVAATYEKSTGTEKKASYSVNKMSKEDRAALVEKLKADQANRQSQLTSIVQKMLSGQTGAYGKANSDSIWSFLAGGNYKVDPQTRLQAQADIAEDGYYGVKQTSQRLFDFASALAGDDVNKMKEMQDAILKGYKMAEKTWGGKLPEISRQTLNATNQLFDDYYASKKNVVTE